MGEGETLVASWHGNEQKLIEDVRALLKDKAAVPSP
jgi:hypothetical protein